MAWTFDGSSSTSTGNTGLYSSINSGYVDQYRNTDLTMLVEFEYANKPSTGNFLPLWEIGGSSYTNTNYSRYLMALYNRPNSPGSMSPAWVNYAAWYFIDANTGMDSTNTRYRWISVLDCSANPPLQRFIYPAGFSGTGTFGSSNYSAGFWTNAYSKIGSNQVVSQLTAGGSSANWPTIFDGTIYRCIWWKRLFSVAECQYLVNTSNYDDINPGQLYTDDIVFNHNLSTEEPTDDAPSHVSFTAGSGASFSDSTVLTPQRSIAPISVSSKPSQLIETGASSLWRMMAFNQVSELYDPSV